MNRRALQASPRSRQPLDVGEAERHLRKSVVGQGPNRVLSVVEAGPNKRPVGAVDPGLGEVPGVRALAALHHHRKSVVEAGLNKRPVGAVDPGLGEVPGVLALAALHHHRKSVVEAGPNKRPVGAVDPGLGEVPGVLALAALHHHRKSVVEAGPNKRPVGAVDPGLREVPGALALAALHHRRSVDALVSKLQAVVVVGPAAALDVLALGAPTRRLHKNVAEPRLRLSKPLSVVGHVLPEAQDEVALLLPPSSVAPTKRQHKLRLPLTNGPPSYRNRKTENLFLCEVVL